MFAKHLEKSHKPLEVVLYILLRVLHRVSHACLCREMNAMSNLVLPKLFLEKSGVANVSFRHDNASFLKLFYPRAFKRGVIVGIEIVASHDKIPALFEKESEMKADEAGDACDVNSFHKSLLLKFCNHSTLLHVRVMKKRKKIVVTGGAGFLGSHLCERLLQEGDEVLCVDNFFTGTKANIERLIPHPHFRYFEFDVVIALNVIVDEIYNLACPASPIHYQHDPVQTIKTCVLGAIRVLDLAREQKCKIFQASTSEIYGDPLEHPQKESYWGHVNPIGSRSCYDEGKRCAETLFFDYHRQYNIPIKVGRIFNTYGPRMLPNDGRVVSNFIVQALKGEPITIYGDGSQTRSFCYVDDLIEAIIRFMRTDVSITGPINLGNPLEFSMLDLAKEILTLTGSSSPIAYKPLPSDDPKQRRPDISLAKSVLSWEPKVSLQEGLGKTIEYFNQELLLRKNDLMIER